MGSAGWEGPGPGSQAFNLAGGQQLLDVKTQP